MAGILKSKIWTETLTHREGHVSTEAEVGAIQLQAEEGRGFCDRRKLESGEGTTLLRGLQRARLCERLDLGLRASRIASK